MKNNTMLMGVVAFVLVAILAIVTMVLPNNQSSNDSAVNTQNSTTPSSGVKGDTLPTNDSVKQEVIIAEPDTVEQTLEVAE